MGCINLMMLYLTYRRYVYEYWSFSIRYDISIIIPIKKYILLYNVYNINKNKNEKYVEFQYLNVNKIYSIWSVSYI